MAETSVSGLLANRESKLTMAAAIRLGCGACEAVSPSCRPKLTETVVHGNVIKEKRLFLTSR